MEELTYQVILSTEAQKEILNIYNYLLEEATLQTANHVKAGLQLEIKKLSKMPSSRGLLQGATSGKYIYRRVIKWSYRIIFAINEADLFVEIVRIDHVKSNPDRLKELE